jgi:predicted DCC family thiol-disulfide oxidoreductase YuxK
VTDTREILFYDGDCGLCHASVRFVLNRDRRDHFRFAPLGGDTFDRTVPVDGREHLPDSLVLLSENDGLLTRSDAVLHVLYRLGGGWRLLARLAAVVPRSLRDRIYDLVARWRRQLFARPAGTCPVVPPSLRGRLLP